MLSVNDMKVYVGPYAIVTKYYGLSNLSNDSICLIPNNIPEWKKSIAIYKKTKYNWMYIGHGPDHFQSVKWPKLISNKDMMKIKLLSND